MTSLVSNAANVAFASGYDIDKIVAVYEGSFNRATDVTAITGDLGDIYTFRIPHGFTRPVAVDLLWKIGGAWTDGGSADSIGDTSIAFCGNTNIHIVSSVFAPAAGTFQYKVVATWIADYDTTNPLVASFNSPTKSTNFDSRDNYQKIYDQGVLTFAAPGTQIRVHDLGRKPNFQVFYEATPGTVWPAYAGGASNPFLYDSAMTECEPYVTTTGLSITLSTVTTPKRAWYKIYLDI